MLRFLATLMTLLATASVSAQTVQPSQPPEVSGDFVVNSFQFSDGTTLPQIKLHYVTLGTPHRDSHGRVTNAVLLLHGTTGTGKAFLAAPMRRELFAPGQPLDASRYYIILPDGLGRGGSSKPSDGLRARFPHYGYNDVVAAQYQLVTQGLGVNHLRLVLGTSMGGMQTWIWGERYPDMMDGLMPIASQPIPMAGRNWFWRQMIVSAIRTDPDWHNGDYAQQPGQWVRTMPIFTLITQNPARMQLAAQTREAATQLYDSTVADARQFDANDVLYWFESSWDYNPEPELGRIKAKLYAVNFADDLINAADLKVMQRIMPTLHDGRYVEIPETDRSYGHQTLAHPEVWKPYLIDLLSSLPAQ
ncbi:alpha/beta fold hydrolase [Burkholderia sp. L27(2015)]|uniref:alpha/beta fold hydrolase n=1 Tax=Burkholderia sp. L27(2015) TaxID=1641858 RepID=UPI00131D3678|nr:alpha/beta fold hydrolase [Burkholderia sp. L27(2015)]